MTDRLPLSAPADTMRTHPTENKKKKQQKKWIQEDLKKIKKKKWLLNVGIWCENIYTADKSVLRIAFTEPNFGDIYVST